MPTSYTNKVVLVTGGTSGIGRATAVAFAREGARVVVAGRRETEGAETVRLLRDAGGDGLFIKADVSKESDVRTLIEQTVATFGGLDCAFNNAGMEQPPGPIDEQEESLFDQIIGVNVKGVWLCLKYQIPEMLRRGAGTIVNNASMSAVVGFPGVPIYTASKHAVLGLTRALALEHAKAGVRINAVCPGAVDGEMFQRFAGDNREVREHMMAMHPMGRLGKPEEIASAVLWLCSEGAGFTTGHALMLDGGYVAA